MSGILLIILLVVPVATTYVFLRYQKKQVKREIKWKMIAGIDKEELVLLKITEKEKGLLCWEHSKEFEYLGEMYDVVESNIVGDTTFYRVWWDHKETKLNRQLQELVSMAMGKNQKKQENQKRLLSFFKSLYFAEATDLQNYNDTKLNRKFWFRPNFYQSFTHSPPVPPPEIS
jgi:hypothetical protein